MMEQWNDYVRFLAALFAIVNPIGAIPLFVSLTGGQPAGLRRRAAVAAAMTTGCVLTASFLAGEWVLRLFGIGVPYFQIGGGLLLILVAVSMFHARYSRAKQTPEESRQAEEQESVGVVPLGTPLLAGPGAISTAIIYSHGTTTWTGRAAGAVICVATAVAVWLILRLADTISGRLGPTGINIINRLMGLILAAVAVKFIADGIGQIFPILTTQ